jgi:hypothetical protein
MEPGAANEGAPQPGSDAPPPEQTPPATTTENPPPGDNPNPAGTEPGNENPDGTPRRPPPKPKTVRERAVEAFKAGDDREGFRLLRVHFAGAPEASEELKEKMAWFPALTRPALAPRIGFAVQYNEASKGFTGKPMPIGSQEVTSFVESLQQKEGQDNRVGGNARPSKFSRGNRNEGGGGGGGGPQEVTEGSDVRSAAAPVQLTYYTGELGESLLAALEERIEKGEYGKLLQDLSNEIAQASRARRDANGDENAPQELNPGDAPPPAANATTEDGGQPGDKAGARRRRTAKASPAEPKASQEAKQLKPAILWLGKEDTRDDVNKAAAAANVDILVIFELTLREARSGGFTNNTTRIKLFSTKTNKPIAEFSPEALINLTVEQGRQKGDKGEDPVEREVTKAIEALDKVLKPVPLPEALTTERAKKRIGDLVAEKPEDPLPVLVEARFYAAKGLLSEDDARAAGVALLGEQGYSKLLAMAQELVP